MMVQLLPIPCPPVVTAPVKLMSNSAWSYFLVTHPGWVAPLKVAAVVAAAGVGAAIGCGGAEMFGPPAPRVIASGPAWPGEGYAPRGHYEPGTRFAQGYGIPGGGSYGGGGYGGFPGGGGGYNQGPSGFVPLLPGATPPPNVLIPYAPSPPFPYTPPPLDLTPGPPVLPPVIPSPPPIVPPGTPGIPTTPGTPTPVHEPPTAALLLIGLLLTLGACWRRAGG